MEAPFLAELDAWGKTLRMRREISSELLRYLAHNKDLSEYPIDRGCHAEEGHGMPREVRRERQGQDLLGTRCRGTQ